MNRRKFLIHLGLAGAAMGIGAKVLNLIGDQVNTEAQPIIFFGHGSPMNAILNNEFSDSWKKIGKSIKPRAIVVISAHWETNGTQLSSGQFNKTIYDFGGFPPELYNVEYPAPGYPELAEEIALKKSFKLSDQWGLDHGAWSVLIHAFPRANIPVIQLSLDRSLSPKQHWELARELKFLRSKGILIVGSGNIVHNLRMIRWQNDLEFDWAKSFQKKVIDSITSKNYENLYDLVNDEFFRISHPTLEHFLPLLYVFALAEEKDNVEIYTPKIELGSLSMASFVINNK